MYHFYTLNASVIEVTQSVGLLAKVEVVHQLHRKLFYHCVLRQLFP